MTKANLKSGDFTGLALEYSKNRPGYSESVRNSLIGLMGRPSKELDFTDVGAGTGIWARMVHDADVKRCVALEPNDDMRRQGVIDSTGTNIEWAYGNAEETGLPDNSIDWVSMASSFHWVNFERSMYEFQRILRPKGYFTALWNPRLVENSPVLLDIERHIKKLSPKLKRVSSGLSGITNSLSDKLWGLPYFDDIVYMEGHHTVRMSKERYIGVWRSVNDLPAQMGAMKFEKFISYVETKIADLEFIESTYLTRAWSARRRG